jgi:hypothetical protein
MLHRALLVACAALALAALTACEDKVSTKSYEQITLGMTLSDVERLLGGKGEKQDTGGVSIGASGLTGGANKSATQSVYVWKKGTKEISVTIQDGKVTAMGKAGF